MRHRAQRRAGITARPHGAGRLPRCAAVFVVLAVAPVLQGAAMLAAAAAAAAVLLCTDPRQRAAAMLAALGFSALAVATLAGDDLPGRRGRARRRRRGRAGRRSAVLAALLRRRPGLIGLLALGALPFRVPLTLGDGDREPAAAALRRDRGRRARRGLALAAAGHAARRRSTSPSAPVPRALRHVEIALAVFVGSTRCRGLLDRPRGGAQERLPVLRAVRGPVPAAARRRLERRAAASRLLARGRARRCSSPPSASTSTPRPPAALQREGPGVQRPQAVLPGQLAVLRPEHLRPLPRADDDRAGRDRSSGAASGAPSVLVALRARRCCGPGSCCRCRSRASPRCSAAWRCSACCAGSGAGAGSDRRAGRARGRRRAARPGSLEIDTRSTASLDKATSGRSTSSAARSSMARDRPVWGFGSGAFAERYRAREGVRSVRVAAVSHTIPLTIAAEQGIIGLLAYVALMATALRLVFTGVRARVRTAAPGLEAIAAAAVAAAFCALVLHTFVYAAFLEDPLSWTLLALAGALAARAPAASHRSRAALAV